MLPFHRAVLDAPEFAAPDGAFGVFTTWIETDFSSVVTGLGGGSAGGGDDGGGETMSRVVVEVGGKRLEVVLPAALAAAGRANSRSGGRRGAEPAATTRSRSRPARR